VVGPIVADSVGIDDPGAALGHVLGETIEVVVADALHDIVEDAHGVGAVLEIVEQSPEIEAAEPAVVHPEEQLG